MSSQLKEADELLKVSEVCQFLHIDRMTFYKLKNKGVLEVIDLNKGTMERPRYRVKPQSLREYVRKQTV